MSGPSGHVIFRFRSRYASRAELVSEIVRRAIRGRSPVRCQKRNCSSSADEARKQTRVLAFGRNFLFDEGHKSRAMQPVVHFSATMVPAAGQTGRKGDRADNRRQITQRMGSRNDGTVAVYPSLTWLIKPSVLRYFTAISRAAARRYRDRPRK